MELEALIQRPNLGSAEDIRCVEEGGWGVYLVCGTAGLSPTSRLSVSNEKSELLVAGAEGQGLACVSNDSVTTLVV